MLTFPALFCQQRSMKPTWRNRKQPSWLKWRPWCRSPKWETLPLPSLPRWNRPAPPSSLDRYVFGTDDDCLLTLFDDHRGTWNFTEPCEQIDPHFVSQIYTGRGIFFLVFITVSSVGSSRLGNTTDLCKYFIKIDLKLILICFLIFFFYQCWSNHTQCNGPLRTFGFT